MRRLMIALAALTACTRPPPGPGDDSAGALRVLDTPPVIVAEAPTDIAQAAREAATVVAAARPARRIEAAAAPFMSASPEGRRFLALPAPGRALAQGAPAERCPGIGLGVAADDLAAASRDALDRCFADLERLGAADCGCRLLALDDTLLAPQAAFTRAPGVGARLLGAGSTGGRPLVADERPAEDDPTSRLVTLRDAAGVIAVARLEADGRATLDVVDGPRRLEGTHTPSGWRRGRLAETLELRDRSGRRALALIGFEPHDLRAAAAPTVPNPG